MYSYPLKSCGKFIFWYCHCQFPNFHLCFNCLCVQCLCFKFQLDKEAIINFAIRNYSDLFELCVRVCKYVCMYSGYIFSYQMWFFLSMTPTPFVKISLLAFHKWRLFLNAWTREFHIYGSWCNFYYQARHGTRSPTKKRIKELDNLATHLEVLLREAEEQNLALEKLPGWLKGWKSPWKGKLKGGELIIQGEDELYDLGIRTRARFPNLFNDDYHPNVYAVKATQVSFVLGFSFFPFCYI